MKLTDQVRIYRNKKIFLYSMIIGLITHMYRLTNWMINEDETHYLNTISASWVTSVGRYLLPVVEKIRGCYELPWLLGFISVVFLSFAAVFIAETFDIRGSVGLLLTAWIVVANPIVTATFSYMYTADGYFFGYAIIALGIMLATKYKGAKGAILGGLCIYVCMGFYQGFLTAAVILILLILIRDFLNEKITVKDTLKNAVRYLIAGGIGIVMYLITVKLVWKYGGYGTTSYMGVGEANTDSGWLIKAFVDCYIDFARVFLVRWQITSYNVMNVLMFIACGIFIVCILTKKRLWKQPVRWLLVGLVLAMLPVASHLFEFISEELSYSTTIMDYGTLLVCMLPVVLAQHLSVQEGDFKNWLDKAYIKRNIMYVAAMMLMLCICFNFTVIANKAYYNMDNANKKVEMLLNRIVMRMEEMPGYHDDMEIMIVGSCYQIPEYVTSAPMMSGVVSNIFLTSEDQYVHVMNKMLSTSYGIASQSTEKAIAQLDEFKAMPTWPDKDCMRIIDDVMVVILSYNDIDLLYED